MGTGERAGGRRRRDFLGGGGRWKDGIWAEVGGGFSSSADGVHECMKYKKDEDCIDI